MTVVTPRHRHGLRLRTKEAALAMVLFLFTSVANELG